jgi:hypothetical protein
VRVFTLGILLIISPVRAQEEKVEYSPELVEKMQALQDGKLTSRQKVKLADDLYRAGGKTEALSLFEENLPQEGSGLDIPKEAYLNYGTALLDSGRAGEALAVYDALDKLLDNSPEASEIRTKMEKNTLSYFKKEKEKKEQEKKDKEKKEQEKKDGKENKDQQGQGENKKQQGESGKQDNKNPEKKGADKKDQKEKGEEEKESEGEGVEEKKDQKNEESSQEVQEKKPLPPKKLAPKLKQLMSDDRQLQMRMIEQGTRELNRKKLRNSKDW